MNRCWNNQRKDIGLHTDGQTPSILVSLDVLHMLGCLLYHYMLFKRTSTTTFLRWFEGEMLLSPTGIADLSHHSNVTSHLYNGLMPFVSFFSRSDQNTERLIKKRQENQLLCERNGTKHLPIFKVLLNDLSAFSTLFVLFVYLLFSKNISSFIHFFSNALSNWKWNRWLKIQLSTVWLKTFLTVKKWPVRNLEFFFFYICPTFP